MVGSAVCAIALLGRWLVLALADPKTAGAYRALPWVALGWALYGLYLVLISIAGRAKVTTRNAPAALAGLVVNVVVLVLAVGPLGIAGAGIALCSAYAVMLAAIHLLTRRLFAVPFEWARMAAVAAVLAAVAVGGELLLPTHGAAGLLSRLALLALVPLLLAPLATGAERALVARTLRRPRGRGV